MARVQKYVFQAPTTTGIAAVQTATSLTFNGPFADVRFGGANFASTSGFARVVQVSSANDLSLITVTVLGSSWSGLPISASIAGPNNSTVSTSAQFASVTSIAGDVSMTAVSAGWGNNGSSRPFTVNSFNTPAQLAIQVDVSGTMTFSTRSTQNDVQQSGILNWFNDTTMSGTASVQGSYTVPPRAVQFTCSGTGGLTAYINPTGI